MLNVWSLTVRRRENDPPDHFLTLLHLSFMGSLPKGLPVSNRSRRNSHILVMSPDPNKNY